MFIRFFVLLLLGALCAPVMHAVDAPVSDNQLHEVEISLSDTEENTSHEFGLAECSTLFTLTGNTSVKE